MRVAATIITSKAPKRTVAAVGIRQHHPRAIENRNRRRSASRGFEERQQHVSKPLSPTSGSR